MSTKITFDVTEGYKGKKLSLECSAESDIEEMKDIFSTILTFLGYHPNTISELFGEEGDCGSLESSTTNSVGTSYSCGGCNYKKCC